MQQQKKRPGKVASYPDHWIINSDLPQKQRFYPAFRLKLRISKMAQFFKVKANFIPSYRQYPKLMLLEGW